MVNISSDTFFSLRKTHLKKVKLLIRSHQGIAHVKTSLIDFLVGWNGRDWIHWEKIDLVFHNLKRVSFWRMIPYQNFLAEAESRVSSESMAELRKLKY